MGNRDRDDTGRFADGIAPESILEVFEARDDRARPITATDVVEELGIARRTAHNKLEILVERGEIETRKVGARGRVWWTPIRDADALDTSDLQGNPNNTIDELDASDSDATVGRDAAETQPSGQRDESDMQPTEATDDAVTGDTQATDPLRAVVEEVAQSWEGTAETVEQRKAAAVAVLEYAQSHGGVSKQEAQEEIRPDHDVDGQNADTWYRKNIRPVLNEAAKYDQTTRSYKLTLDTEQQS